LSEVTVYVKPGCPECVATKDLMDDLGVIYNSVDISINKEALMLLRAKKFRGAPVVVTSEKSWSGFNESEIRNLVAKTEVELAAEEEMWDY
jgi:glutaredoxin-like protein NrdH